MQFLLIICHDDHFAPAENLVTEIKDWVAAMDARGVRKGGNPLRPWSEATTVRVREGQVVLSEGPFAPSEEKMCAYELIECADAEEAVEVASGHPMAKVGTVEVRPIWSGLA